MGPPTTAAFAAAAQTAAAAAAERVAASSTGSRTTQALAQDEAHGGAPPRVQALLTINENLQSGDAGASAITIAQARAVWLAQGWTP